MNSLSGDALADATFAEAGVAMAGPAPHRGEIVGLVFAVSHAEGAPVSSLQTGGIPIISRQIRQLHALGLTRVVLALGTGQAGALDHARQEAARDQLELTVTDSAEKLTETLAGRMALAIDEGLLVDERMLLAFFADTSLHSAPRPVLATRDEAKTQSAGLAIFPAGTLTRTLSSGVFAKGLEAVSASAVQHHDLSGLDDYAPARRRHLPMVWLPLRSAADGHAGTAVLIESAQKGCLDWPARFFHPPIENLLTRLLLPTPITPNMVSVFVFLLGLYAAWCFATGAWPLALALIIVIGPLDGLDGKLARSRLDFSPYGDLEHVADKVVEYACYLCMAAWLSAGWAWASCALIVLFALAEAVQGEFYRRVTGGQLDDAGTIERRFRLVSGRRNTFMWTLIPFVVLDAWEAGFVMIAIYSVVTFFFMQWRFITRLGQVAREASPIMAENLRRTDYAFMKKGK
ncbi:CDP-alcohol phosphatidyltransferase family protein [Novosphingobium aquae]|uniref:CDP-alcohol phosphatidyltransferase family protein n=1 Tax=Novosphingobium aquae TaxID=3133435 RepID=A0ABU8S9I1_9SPHN